MNLMSRSLVFLAGLLAAAAADAGESAVRVGTFRRAEVLVAYYRSAAWHATLEAKRKERDEAKAAGDAEKVQRLEAWAERAQELAHRQLAGLASLDANGLLDHLKTLLPAVAAKARVRLVVEQPLFRDEGVELVDVTALIAKGLPPAKP
jgi:hypothetical protein